jgi:hypothetical protein
MDINRLTFWLNDLVPSIYEIDGYLFVDKQRKGVPHLRQEITQYPSLKEAQEWMNIVLVESFLDEACGEEWEASNEAIGELLAVYDSAWSYQVRARFPEAQVIIEKLIDEDAGDIGLRLVQDAPFVKPETAA